MLEQLCTLLLRAFYQNAKRTRAKIAAAFPSHKRTEEHRSQPARANNLLVLYVRTVNASQEGAKTFNLILLLWNKNGS